jgi:hypothetical protein
MAAPLLAPSTLQVRCQGLRFGLQGARSLPVRQSARAGRGLVATACWPCDQELPSCLPRPGHQCAAVCRGTVEPPLPRDDERRSRWRGCRPAGGNAASWANLSSDRGAVCALRRRVAGSPFFLRCGSSEREALCATAARAPQRRPEQHSRRMGKGAGICAGIRTRCMFPSTSLRGFRLARPALTQRADACADAPGGHP